MRDATEYRFAAGEWRVLVRGTDAGGDGVGMSPGVLAGQAAKVLREVMGARDVRAEDERPTAEGGVAAVVRGVLPAAEGRAGSEVRTAFLRFGDGSMAELTLHAPAGDAGAEAEFLRLVDTARPSGRPGAVESVAEALRWGDRGRPGYPAGPIALELGPEYHTPSSFTLASDDGRERYQLQAAPAVAARNLAGPTRGGASLDAPFLCESIDETRAEDGRVVRFEAPFTPGGGDTTRAAVRESFAVRGQEADRAVDAAPEDGVVNGQVGQTPVRVRVEADGEAGARSLGEDLLRRLNNPPGSG